MNNQIDCQFLNTLRYNDHENDVKNNLKSQRVFIIVIIAFFILISIGTIGFKYMFNLDWLDALYAAALVITGINIEAEAVSAAQKWFVIIYSILAVVVYLSMASAAMDYLLTHL